MKLSYADMLSFAPIKLSIGSIRKPRLSEIAELSFDYFAFYQMMIHITPEMYFMKIKKGGADIWKSLPDSIKAGMDMVDLCCLDDEVGKAISEILNYFFIEHVIFISESKMFLIVKNDKQLAEVTKDDISGVITKNTFGDVTSIIQQVCCVYSEKEEVQPKFKNKKAKELYEKLQRAENEKKAKENKNLSLQNVISAVSNRHPTISPITIWDMTLFQLYDSFERLQNNQMFDLISLSVAVWGDEKNKYDSTLWFKNNYDK